MSGASISAADKSANRVNVGHGCADSAAPPESFGKLDFDRDNEMMTMLGRCPQCEAEGETRMLMTSIPLFREIIVASFNCDHCGHANTSVDFGGAYQDQGSIMILKVESENDLQRQVVKSDSCVIKIPEMEFEIAPNPEHKQGVFTTLQGVLTTAIEGVDWMIWHWKEQIPSQPHNMETILSLLNDLGTKKEQLETLLQGQTPFTLLMDDPAGNSFISTLTAKDVEHDPQVTFEKYTRTPQQNRSLGFTLATDEEDADGVISSSKPLGNASMPSGAKQKPKITYDDSAWLKFQPSHELDDAVMTFGTFCEACGKECMCNMFQFQIPHFREVILMSASCEACGNRSREIKPGGAVPDLGRRCTLSFQGVRDLHRGIIKSDSCSVRIPEIDMEMQPGTLGGMFTTIEGLLSKVQEHLEESNPFGQAGDARQTMSEGSEQARRFREFLSNLEELALGETPFTLILEDAMAGSYIENPLAPEEDPQLVVVDYERSYEENEDLGLNDLKTEGYEDDQEKDKAARAAPKSEDVEEDEEDDKPVLDEL